MITHYEFFLNLKNIFITLNDVHDPSHMISHYEFFKKIKDIFITLNVHDHSNVKAFYVEILISH